MELGLCNHQRHCRRNSCVFVCDEGGGGCYEEKASLVEERQVVCVLGMRWLLPLLF
jgi:hypothetical protein